MNKSRAEILEYIKSFADRAHGTQVRKYTGDRYIVHPVRVMEMVRQYNDDICVLAAALLHDVLEDTPVSAAELRDALHPVLEPDQVAKVMELVVDLTDVYVKKDYPRLNRRSRKEKESERMAAVSAEAQSIKYADIIDNVRDIVSQDMNFAKIFVREAKNMLERMDAGNPRLREKALGVVNECLCNVKKEIELS